VDWSCGGISRKSLMFGHDAGITQEFQRIQGGDDR
jgi:hypothetical protein